jgi:hypothetical protein
LTAKCPKGVLYTWKSIMHGRKLLGEGEIWRIGDGAEIKVWEDNWIPRQGLKRPWGIKPNKQVQTINELLLPERQGWNVAKLNDLFYEEDVADIVRIPVGRAGTDDYAAWNYTKNGVFTVKSAYHLNVQMQKCRKSNASTSLSVDEHKGWLALWSAEVPGKAKIHVWRLIKNGLAVGQELARRQIKEGVRCIACNREESLLHRFCQCPHARATWDPVRESSGLQLRRPDMGTQQHKELAGWILIWLGSMEEKELAVGVMVFYQMWLARNAAREEVKIMDPRDVANCSIYLVEELMAIKQQTHKLPPVQADEHSLVQKGPMVPVHLGHRSRLPNRDPLLGTNAGPGSSMNRDR